MPWRKNHSPYRVWVSEVMLQQTQVSVVIPYFEKWMNLFPTIEALAAADIKDVIKAWEGLGYYSRARNLYAGALEIVKRYEGIFPSTIDELLKIKGLGPYTAGAIMAFAYQKKAVAIDGNVRRVLARYKAIEKSIDLPVVQKELHKIALDLLPDSDSHIVMEGLIELGALVCQKKPQCAKCPLSIACKAYQSGLEQILPMRKKRPKTLALHRLVYILIHDDSVLVRQEKASKVMEDLWHFPFFELKGHFAIAEIEQIITGMVGQVVYKDELEMIKHGFTRYQATLYPHIWKVEMRQSLEDHTWVSIKELEKLPFCSGHRTLANKLMLCT